MAGEDTDLETRAVQGDVAAFGQLIRQFDRQLRSVVWSVVGRQLSVDDVMQAAYEKAFISLGSFNQRSSMKTWLHTICYRTALDQLRYEKQRRHEDIDAISNDADGFSTSDAALNAIELERLFSGLSPDHRVLMMLTAGLGFTVDETSEILGVSRGTAASRISRARAKLREENVV